MRKLPAEIYTAAECRSLLRVCGRGRTAARNRAIIVVLWRAGLRVAESLALDPKDVDLDSGTIRVLRGKGGKARTVALDPEGCAVVREWAALRGELLRGKRGKRSAPLFCTLDGAPIHTSYVRQLLPRLGRRAGVAKRVHAHGLRHTFAVELVREGQPITIVQAALGHSNAAVTSRYIAHLEMPELMKALRERSWLTSSAPPPGEVLLRGRGPARASLAHAATRTTSTRSATGSAGRKSESRSGRARRSVAGAARRARRPAPKRPTRSRRARKAK